MSHHATGMLAVDLGGTRLRAAVFDAAGEMRSHVVEHTPPDDSQALRRGMMRAMQDADLRPSQAVVGVPGVIDHAAGTALFLPQLPGWDGAITAASLGEALGMPVTLANDADLAALGEHRFGAGAGVENMVYLTCSTGVGAGVIVGGRLLRTRYSLAEIGHTVIDWRTGETVEQLGSGTALGRRTGELAAVVEQRARDGDEAAAAQFREMAEAFAVGVLTMIYCFMPDRVVVGGGVARAGEMLLGPVRERIGRTARLPFSSDQIVQSALGDDAGLLGGYAYWLDQTRTGA